MRFVPAVDVAVEGAVEGLLAEAGAEDAFGFDLFGCAFVVAGVVAFTAVLLTEAVLAVVVDDGFATDDAVAMFFTLAV